MMKSHTAFLWNRVITQTGFIFWLSLFILTFTGLPDGAPALGAPPAAQDSTGILLRQAAQAADEAWEEFHRAAIGGTLASPAIQVSIEQQLHEVRKLLMEARKAERAHQVDSVKRMTEKIFDITHLIVQASRERKL